MMVMVSFAILVLGGGTIFMGVLQPGAFFLLILTVAATSVGVYALRGVYFALLEEGKVPMAVTGSAIGVVSVLGFTPDIFMGPLMGYLLDRSPGALGHEHVFGVLALFALVGLLAAVCFRIVVYKKD